MFGVSVTQRWTFFVFGTAHSLSVGGIKAVISNVTCNVRTFDFTTLNINNIS